MNKFKLLLLSSLLATFNSFPLRADTQRPNTRCAFTTPTSQVVGSMDINCNMSYKSLAVADINGITGIATVKLLPGITITPGTISVGNYNETQTIPGITAGDSCIALQTSTPVLGTTTLGLIQGLAANSGKVFFGNTGLIGISLGSFTATLLCTHT